MPNICDGPAPPDERLRKALPRVPRQMPEAGGAERQLARLDAEGGQRVGDRVGDHAADRDDAALAGAVGPERIYDRGIRP